MHRAYIVYLLTGLLLRAAFASHVEDPSIRDDECLLKECALNVLQRRALERSTSAPEVAALPVKPTEEPSLPSPEEDVPEPAEPEPAEAEEVPEETAPESVEKEETEETGPESVEKEETEETGPEPVEKEETEDTEDTAPESVEAEEEKEEKEETEPATSVDVDSETDSLPSANGTANSTQNPSANGTANSTQTPSANGTANSTKTPDNETSPKVEVVCTDGADPYAQCGGEGWKGPTCCKGGRICHETNKYYFSCMTAEEATTTTTTTTARMNTDPEHCQLEYEQCAGTNSSGLRFLGKDCCQGGTVCTEVDPNYYQCLPPKKGGPHFVYKPSAELQKPSDGTLFTFYVYRAESADEDYVTNVNVANLPGVMWYLHNEVVWQTPRKFNISRVYRHKIMVRATQPLLDLGMNFGVRFAYDAAQCTGPWNCDNYFEKYGYFVGCNNLGMFPFPTYKIYYDDAKWFTLPGTCSSNAFEEKDASCIHDQPGGMCEGIPTGEGDCTYSISAAGDLSVDEIEGISDYAAFIKAGNEEFNKTADKGVGLTFWDGLNDSDANAARVAHVVELFEKKYPNMPSESDMLAPICDFNFDAFYTGTTSSTTTLPTTATTTLKANCKDATPGSSCYGAVQWAMKDGIRKHPTWYPGLSATSSFSDFQAHVHQKQPDVCEAPCGAAPAAPAEVPPPPAPAVAPAGCSDATPGSACYGAVQWAIQTGIRKHPTWYPGLSATSSFSDFQAHVHQKQPDVCDAPCGAAPAAAPAVAPAAPVCCPGCSDAQPGTSCYSAVRWAMKYGIKEHPHWYHGLTATSSFRDFQAQVHKATPKKCPPPCA